MAAIINSECWQLFCQAQGSTCMHPHTHIRGSTSGSFSSYGQFVFDARTAVVRLADKSLWKGGSFVMASAHISHDASVKGRDRSLFLISSTRNTRKTAACVSRRALNTCQGFGGRIPPKGSYGAFLSRRWRAFLVASS